MYVHILLVLCATVTMFQQDYYNIQATHEGTIQGDPTALTVYLIGLTPLLKQLVTCYPKRDPKMVAFADDLTR